MPPYCPGLAAIAAVERLRNLDAKVIVVLGPVVSISGHAVVTEEMVRTNQVCSFRVGLIDI